ncbi:MAG: hypothetical protein FWG87_02250 [Defluviitaleaceae bacterium]|nr:hypothetical protein [Defluviitaleaceae bacterium]
MRMRTSVGFTRRKHTYCLWWCEFSGVRGICQEKNVTVHDCTVSAKSTFNLYVSASCVYCGVIVGDGFIRPEATSLCVNGRCPARIDER